VRVDKNKKLRPSVLDRLFDNEPHNQVEQDVDQYQHLKQLRSSIRRDLEYLLNCRYCINEPPSELCEVQHSLFNYGLPDLATINIIDIEQRSRFIRKLERTLLTYEPRFKSMKITFLDNDDSIDRTLRFRIETVIYADPLPEVVIYDSVLESTTRSVSVKEISHG